MRLMPFLEAGNAPNELVPLEAAVGRIAASEVGFYPPAVPLVIRGEVITEEICDIISRYSGKLFGINEGRVLVVK